MPRFRDSSVVYGVLCLLLLAGIGTHRSVTRTAIDATAYHAKVKAAVDGIGWAINDWVGAEVPVPTAAVVLLRPNALLGRSYRNPHGNRVITLVVVQCQDTRDLAGHYPPNCYPANGWKLRNTERLDNLLPGLDLPVTSYFFDRSSAFETSQKWVYNILLLPVRGGVADMDDVREAASNQVARQRGAAQIQLVLSGDVPLSDQKEFVREFLRELEPVIRDIIDFQGASDR